MDQNRLEISITTATGEAIAIQEVSCAIFLMEIIILPAITAVHQEVHVQAAVPHHPATVPAHQEALPRLEDFKFKNPFANIVKGFSNRITASAKKLISHHIISIK